MDDSHAAKWLESTECPACGGAKKAQQSFCGSCYWKLPEGEMRNDLYKRLGAGYTRAFNRALGWLREHQG